MNTLSNQVRLIGHLGADPELKELDNNKKLARLSIATNESYKKKDGDWETSTQWHPVVAWDNTAERMTRRLKKGQHVVISGKLIHRAYDDDQGNKKYISEVVVRDFLKLTKDEVPV